MEKRKNEEDLTCKMKKLKTEEDIAEDDLSKCALFFFVVRLSPGGLILNSLR